MDEVSLWSPCVVRIKGERRYIRHYNAQCIDFVFKKNEAFIFENSPSIADFAEKAAILGIHYVLEVPAKRIPNDSPDYILQITGGNCNGNYLVRYRGKYCYSSQFESAGKRMTKMDALRAQQLIRMRYGYDTKIKKAHE